MRAGTLAGLTRKGDDGFALLQVRDSLIGPIAGRDKHSYQGSMRPFVVRCCLPGTAQTCSTIPIFSLFSTLGANFPE